MLEHDVDNFQARRIYTAQPTEYFNGDFSIDFVFRQHGSKLKHGSLLIYKWGLLCTKCTCPMNIK